MTTPARLDPDAPAVDEAASAQGRPRGAIGRGLSDDELRRVRDWCAARHKDKPWYGEAGDSPKALVKCDFMVEIIDEVLAARAEKAVS